MTGHSYGPSYFLYLRITSEKASSQGAAIILILLHWLGEIQIYLSWHIYLNVSLPCVVFIIEPGRKCSFNAGPLEPKESVHQPLSWPRLHPQFLLLGVCVSASQTSAHYQVDQLASGDVLKSPFF